jgi:hypothetical protein
MSSGKGSSVWDDGLTIALINNTDQKGGAFGKFISN